MEVRKFNKNDIEFIVGNWLGTDRLDGVFQNDTIEKIEKRITFWQQEKNDKGNVSLGYAIEYKERLIGVAWFTENIKGQLTYNLYLDVDYRGRGYGVQASKIIEEDLKKKGFKNLKSSCAQDNLASSKMHRKLGFKLVKEELSPNGTPMQRWEKEL